MRQYTREFVEKEWDELTVKQQEEIKDYLFRDDLLMELYNIGERELYEEYIYELKRKYKDVYDDIDLDWSSNSHGPYVEHPRGWTVDLHGYPSEIVDLSDVGIDGEIEVTIRDVYPDHYDYVLPDLYHMDVEFDYSDDLNVDYSELEDYLFEESTNGEAFLKKWAEILSKPLEEYWEICAEYTRGFQDVDEWLEAQVSNGQDVRIIYSVEEDGNEVFEELIWE